jgi:hypothetical protein
MPDVMKIFDPFTTYSPLSRRAVVWIAATSDPPDGSVIARHAIFSPRRMARSTRAFNSGEPAAAMGGAPIEWLIKLAATPPQAGRLSSSVLMMVRNGSWSAIPPYSSGKPSRSRPISEALKYSSRGKVSASSHSFTNGAISASTQRRSVRRQASCSSV